MGKAIEIKYLKKYYGKARGVIDVSFDVFEGEILGFIGPNGAGKSTVIRVLMGLLNKTSGQVSVFLNKPSYLVNKDIGYLPSEVFLYSELKVEDQLLYFAKVRGCPTERIYELATELDLDLHRKIRELSFGNRKKVGIICALMHSPKVIILDEPTSGLDPLIQQNFFNILIKEKKKGAAILLSSHVLNEVEKVCDRVCLIKEGRTLFCDTIQNLKKTEFKKVFISPIYDDIKLDGLEYISRANNQIVYSFKGDINDLLKVLSYYRLNSLEIVNLDLEEIFLHYYQKEEKNV